MDQKKINWIDEVNEGMGGWSSLASLIASSVSLTSLVIRGMELSPSAFLLGILSAYQAFVHIPLSKLLAFVGLTIDPMTIDLLVFWFAIGGITFRTATTIQRKGVLGTETGQTIWLERLVNNLSTRTEFIILKTRKKYQKEATVLSEPVDTFSLKIEDGKTPGLFIAEDRVIKYFAFRYAIIILRSLISIIVLVAFWPVSLFLIFRSPKLCHEFSGAKALFGRQFKAGGKMGLIVDLRRIFTFQVIAFLAFTLLFIALNFQLTA